MLRALHRYRVVLSERSPARDPFPFQMCGIPGSGGEHGHGEMSCVQIHGSLAFLVRGRTLPGQSQ